MFMTNNCLLNLESYCFTDHSLLFLLLIKMIIIHTELISCRGDYINLPVNDTITRS